MSIILALVRWLAHIIDEPPGLLGDETAPNPSEAVLAALGSCIAVGIHANCVYKGIDLYKRGITTSLILFLGSFSTLKPKAAF